MEMVTINDKLAFSVAFIIPSFLLLSHFFPVFFAIIIHYYMRDADFPKLQIHYHLEEDGNLRYITTS